MIEIRKNIFSAAALSEASAICITTNGIVKRNGEAVMGAGVAKQARNKWPHLPKALGKHLQRIGNFPGLLHFDEETWCWVTNFPTKNHWKDKSSVELIKTSAKVLRFIADGAGMNKVYLPPPGCGLGGLSKEIVYPVLDSYLDDRFIICYL